MEMNSHQKVPSSQPSANSQPIRKPRRPGLPRSGCTQVLALQDTRRSAR